MASQKLQTTSHQSNSFPASLPSCLFQPRRGDRSQSASGREETVTQIKKVLCIQLFILYNIHKFCLGMSLPVPHDTPSHPATGRKPRLAAPRCRVLCDRIICDIDKLYLFLNYPPLTRRPRSGEIPPLDCLRFFEAAARRQSFARAAGELDVSAAAACASTPRAAPISRRCSASWPTSTASPSASACIPGGCASCRSRRWPRSGWCRGWRRSRRRIPASPSSSIPTTGASTRHATTSTPGSPTPARLRRRAR